VPLGAALLTGAVRDDGAARVCTGSIGGWYQPKPFVWQAFDRRSPDERVFVCPFVSLSCVRFVCVSFGRTFGHIDQAG